MQYVCIYIYMRDAMVGLHKLFPRFELLGTLYLSPKTTHGICERTPRLAFQWTGGTLNGAANGNVLIHVLVQLSQL